MSDSCYKRLHNLCNSTHKLMVHITKNAVLDLDALEFPGQPVHHWIAPASTGHCFLSTEA